MTAVYSQGSSVQKCAVMTKIEPIGEERINESG